MSFVLSLFTSIFICWQPVLRQSNWFCKPVDVVGNKAILSANNKINSSMTPGTSCIPCLPFAVTWFASWLMNKENSIGLSTHETGCSLTWNQQSYDGISHFRQITAEVLSRWDVLSNGAADYMKSATLWIWHNIYHNFHNTRHNFSLKFDFCTLYSVAYPVKNPQAYFFIEQ